jgi:fucose 4-O-acetylase-like acetyltransferase
MAWIDYARGISIILVCYRHCFEGLKEAGLGIGDFHLLKILNICFYSFRMPLFFIISGLFLSGSLAKKGLGDYVKSRFNVVFYPLIIWGSVQITLQLLLKNYVNAKPSAFDYINLIIWPRNPSNNQQFWYLNALFFVGAIYAFFKIKLHFKLIHQVVLSVFFYTLAAYLNYNGISFYIFPDIFHFYIYFCLGDAIAGYVLNTANREEIVSMRWMLPSFIVFIIVQTIFTSVNLNHGNDDYINLKMPVVFLLISVCGCLFMIQLTQLLEKTGKFKWLRVVGYHSLYIYLMHIMAIAAIRILMVHVLHIEYIPVIIFVAIVFGIIAPILFYNFMVRLGAWWLFSLKKPVAEIKFHAAIRMSQ